MRALLSLTLLSLLEKYDDEKRKQRLKNTSMPTRDMERFVELSHREEEDEEDMQGGRGDGAMNNNANNTNSVGSFETNGNADRRMMEHSKSHPRMLKSTFFSFFSLFPVFVFEKKFSLRVRGDALSFNKRGGSADASDFSLKTTKQVTPRRTCGLWARWRNF